MISVRKSFLIAKMSEYLETKKDALDILSEIFMLAEPEWMARKEKFPRMVEYYLMESIREGLSMHLLNETACIAIDFEKLKLQFQYALGKNKINCNNKIIIKTVSR